MCIVAEVITIFGSLVIILGLGYAISTFKHSGEGHEKDDCGDFKRHP